MDTLVALGQTESVKNILRQSDISSFFRFYKGSTNNFFSGKIFILYCKVVFTEKLGKKIYNLLDEHIMVRQYCNLILDH